MTGGAAVSLLCFMSAAVIGGPVTVAAAASAAGLIGVAAAGARVGFVCA